MVNPVNKIPALFLPKRGANEDHPMTKTPASDNQQKQPRSLDGNKKKNSTNARLTTRVR